MRTMLSLLGMWLLIASFTVGQEKPVEVEYFEEGQRQWNSIAEVKQRDIAISITLLEQLRDAYNHPDNDGYNDARTFEDFKRHQKVVRDGMMVIQGRTWQHPEIDYQLYEKSIGKFTRDGQPYAVDVVSVTPDGVLFEDKTKIFMLTGIDTTKYVNNASYRLDGYYRVKGTFQYKNLLGGNRSVFEVVPLTGDEIERCMAYVEANMKPAPRNFRNWEDITGKFQVNAEFVSYEKGQVTLRKDDESTKTVPFSKLSKQDRQWVLEQRELEKLIKEPLPIRKRRNSEFSGSGRPPR